LSIKNEEQNTMTNFILIWTELKEIDNNKRII